MGSVPAIWMRWLAVGREREDQLVPTLAAREGVPEDSMEVRLSACALLDTIGVAMEHWAWQDEAEDGAELTRRALHCLRINAL
ncbi:acyl-CoA-like ligand-binding transcription factor [Streptomyces nigrescens]